MTRHLNSAATSVILAALVATGCGGATPPAERQAQAPLSVTLSAAEMTTVGEPLHAGGVVTAQETAVIASRIVAPVLAVRVRAGDPVRRGDVLVTLDARDAAAQARQATAGVTAAEQGLAQARSDLAAAQAEQTLAAAWHTRISSLRDRNAATAQEFDDASARLAGTNARVAGAQARIEQATASLAGARAGGEGAATTESFAVLRAPFDGVVTESLTDPGNLAMPGVPLLRIDGGGRRRVEVRVDESRATFLHPGDRVDVLIDDGPGGAARRIDGSVVEVARAVAADQRAFTVKVSLPAGEAARTGTFARVRFQGASRQALRVPSSAVRRQGQVASVFVVQDGTARLRLIQLGALDGDAVEVLAGLGAGERIVTAPPPGLVDGRPVSVTSSAARGRGERGAASARGGGR